MDNPGKRYPVTLCMDVHKTRIQYYGSLEKLKLIIVFRGDLNNREIILDTWDPIESMRTLNYFLADAAKRKQKSTPIGFHWNQEC